jgi:hypothetical protein
MYDAIVLGARCALCDRNHAGARVCIRELGSRAEPAQSILRRLGSLCAQISSPGCSCFRRWSTVGSGRTVRPERACSSAAS